MGPVGEVGGFWYGERFSERAIKVSAEGSSAVHALTEMESV